MIEELPFPKKDTARIETLEFKVAHLEKALQDLSDVMYRQQKQLDAVLEVSRDLRGLLEDIDGRTRDPGAIEIPPHY